MTFKQIKPYEQFKLKPKGPTLIKLDEQRYISPAGTHKVGHLTEVVYEIKNELLPRLRGVR